MRIERCRCGNAGTDCGQYGDRRHAPGARRGIAIFRAHCDAVAWQADEAEPLSALLRDNDSLATTNEVGIQEARPRDKARVADGSNANTFEQRTVAL